MAEEKVPSLLDWVGEQIQEALSKIVDLKSILDFPIIRSFHSDMAKIEALAILCATIVIAICGRPALNCYRECRHDHQEHKYRMAHLKGHIEGKIGPLRQPFAAIGA